MSSVNIWHLQNRFIFLQCALLLEDGFQVEQRKMCAKRLSFERNGEVPNDFLHMAEQEGGGLSCSLLFLPRVK